MTLISESDTEIGRQLLSIVDKKEAPAAESVAPPPAPDSEPEDSTEEAAAAGEDTTDDAPEGDEDSSPDDPADYAQPSIDPPAGLTADEADVFRNSPPEVQKAWARREQERQREFRKWQNQQAEANKAYAESAKAIENERQALAARMQEYGSTIETEFAKKFGNVKDPTELLNDPMRLLEYQAMQSKLAMYYQQRNVLQQQQQQDQERSFRDFRQAENDKLRHWLKLDDKSAAEFEDKTVQFIAQELASDGWEQDRIVRAIREASAPVLKMAHEARLWRESQARRAQAEKAKAPPPKVMRPGTKVDATPAQERSKQAFNNLRKSGRLEDAAAFFKNII